MADAVLTEAAPEVPAILLSPAWGTLLSLGGLVLVVGSLGYAVLQMSDYESEIASLRAQLAGPLQTPVIEATPAPLTVPSETPSAVPTVVVTETVAATSAPAPGGASADQTRKLEAQVKSLRQQLEQAETERDQARKNAELAQQCQSRLNETQHVLERIRKQCGAAPAVSLPATTRPQ